MNCPFKQYAGFIAASRSAKNKGWVVIYDAAAQGIDVGENLRGKPKRYAVVCEKHHAILGESNLSLARKSMRYPEFCDDCRPFLK